MPSRERRDIDVPAGTPQSQDGKARGDQPFGQRSRKSLSNTVMGKPVKVVWSKRDGHRRIVGTGERDSAST